MTKKTPREDVKVEIKNLASEIQIEKTAKYFEEVLSNYLQGNYRSAMVMLWSVVVCDLLLRFQLQQNAYSNVAIDNQLKHIEDLQNSGSKDSSWEVNLFDVAKKSTFIIDGTAHKALLDIQTRRHSCAHPVLTADNLLFSPTKENIENAILDSLKHLLNTPKISKADQIEISNDLHERKEEFKKLADVSHYVNDKFYTQISLATKLNLFKNFWKLTFKVEAREANERRKTNFYFLKHIIDDIPLEISSEISANQSIYSKIGYSKSILNCLDFLFFENPEIFSYLPKSSQTLIRTEVIKSHGYFKHDLKVAIDKGEKLVEIASEIEEQINGDPRSPKTAFTAKTFSQLIENCNKLEILPELIKQTIPIFLESAHFVTADYIFKIFIKPLLGVLRKKDLIMISSKWHNKPQIKNNPNFNFFNDNIKIALKRVKAK